MESLDEKLQRMAAEEERKQMGDRLLERAWTDFTPDSTINRLNCELEDAIANARLNSQPSPLSAQVGGTHYKDMAIQPVEFITKNGLGFLEGCVVKRMCRWQRKNGIEDLRKAIHEIELLIEMTLEPQSKWER